MKKVSSTNVEAPEVSLILSCYDRPELLPMALGSIYAQSMRDFNVLITDNAPDRKVAAKHLKITEWFMQMDAADGIQPRFSYLRTAGRLQVDDCYWSAEAGVEWLRTRNQLGRWLGFPCDDTQYVPMYMQTMLAKAAKNLWECVTVGLPVVSPVGVTKSVAGYQVWEPENFACKTSFLMRSKHFTGFSAKPLSPGPGASDTMTVRELQGRGVRTGTVMQSLMVHN